MNILAPLSLSCLMVSCTIVTHPTAGNYRSLGGDVDGYTQDSNGFSFARNNNSTAFMKTTEVVGEMFRNYLLARGLEFVAGKYYGLEGTKVGSAETVKLEELRNAKSAADAAARIEELKLMEVAL